MSGRRILSRALRSSALRRHVSLLGIDQGARSAQIRRRKAFREPVVDRGEYLPPFAIATLSDPQAGKAEGDPKLSKQGALLARHLARPIKPILGRRSGLTCALLQRHFALDAQQLGDVPHLAVRALPGAGHRLIHRSERLIELPQPGKRRGQRALKLRKRHAPPGSRVQVSNASRSVAKPVANSRRSTASLPSRKCPPLRRGPRFPVLPPIDVHRL